MEAGTSHGAPRMHVTYYCLNGHRTRPAFAMDAEAPSQWECPTCGLPAGQDPDNPPPRPRSEVYKTHLEYVRERRSDDEADRILAEALQSLRDRRADGDVLY